MSEQTQKRYRLPTEAEWEYAARSGREHLIWAGTSSEQDLGNFAWYSGNSGGKTQEVGTKKENSSGLHDMSGNVWEWVEDCRRDNYNGAPSGRRAWTEENNGQCGWLVIRGGSWGFDPADLRSSTRGRDTADDWNYNFGFRLAQDLE